MAFDIGNITDYMNQSDGGSDLNSLDSLFQGGNDLLSILGESNPYTAAFADLFNIGTDFANGNIGGGIGSLLLGPLGGMFGGLLQGLFSGVPTPAKTLGAGQTLRGSGNPMLSMLGGFLDQYGGGSDNVLSNPTFAHETNTLADALTWLSGSALPGWRPMGTTGEIANIPPPPGAPYNKGVNIMGIESPAQLAATLGPSPDLNPFQIAQILPGLENLVRQPGETVAGLKDWLHSQTTNLSGGGTQQTGGGQGGFGGFGGGEIGSILELLPLFLMMGSRGFGNLFGRSGGNSFGGFPGGWIFGLGGVS